MLLDGIEWHLVAGQPKAQGLRDHGWDDVGIAHRGQRDEVHTVRKLVERLRGHLQAEARLADPSGTGQGHQPAALQHMLGAGDHLTATDEARQLGGQVVRCPVDGAQRREDIGHAVHDQLEQVLRPGQVAQAVRAEVPERQLGWQAPVDQRLRRLRHEHLAAVRRARDAGRVVHVEADVLLAHERRLARVQTDADTQRATFRPRMLRKRALSRRRRLACIHRACEDAEERVAFGAQLAAVVCAKGVAEQLVVDHLQGHVPLAQLLHQPRRSLDVRKEKRDRACGKRHVLGRDKDGLKKASNAWARSVRCWTVSKFRNGSSANRVSCTFPSWRT